MKIWKYILRFGQTFISMPEGAKILTVQKQKEDFCLWAAVNPESDVFKVRCIILVGTGAGNASQNDAYISTVQDGDFVWHFFEKDANDDH